MVKFWVDVSDWEGFESYRAYSCLNVLHRPQYVTVFSFIKMFLPTATFDFYSKLIGQGSKDYSSPCHRRGGGSLEEWKGLRPGCTMRQDWVAWDPDQFSLPCYSLSQRLSHVLVLGKRFTLVNYLQRNKFLCDLALQRQKKGHMWRGRGRDESTGSVTATAPYVDLTSISSHPVSSLWFGRPSQRTGPGGGPAGRSGAEAATCQARQLQHRGAAGGGRLGGTLPRQGARAELRTYPYEHCECPLVLGLGGWVGTHQDWSACRVSLRLGVFSVDSRESLFAL